jgi:hypothetical protein
MPNVKGLNSKDKLKQEILWLLNSQKCSQSNELRAKIGEKLVALRKVYAKEASFDMYNVFEYCEKEFGFKEVSILEVVVE